MPTTITNIAAAGSYISLYSGEVSANTSSTTAESLTTINLGSTAVTDDTLLYIKIKPTIIIIMIGFEYYMFNFITF